MNTAWRHSFPLPSLFEAPLKIGEHRYKALCPSHEERNASCVVNYHRKFGWRWHCFACNADGDALDVLTLRGMAVREALERLGSNGDVWDLGLPVPKPLPARRHLQSVHQASKCLRKPSATPAATSTPPSSRASTAVARRPRSLRRRWPAGRSPLVSTLASGLGA